MIGQKFGKLTALKRIVIPKTYKTMYLCRCECGNEKIVRTDSLKVGTTVSCGCYHKERTTTHGLTNHRLYKTWDAMKQRCFNPNCDVYQDYGGRGITVCDEWGRNFKSFYDWAMRSGYSDQLTIDRKDVNGDYEPGNCRWVTMLEQNQNKRNTLTPDQIREIKSDPRSHTTIAADFGVNQSTITRIKNGLRWKNIHEYSDRKEVVNMARIHDTITISSGNHHPSLGSLIGSRVSSDVFDSINTHGHSSFFGSDFDHLRHEFFDRHVRPMDALNLEISRTVNMIMNPDQFRILESVEDFRSIPTCMEMSILLFDPIRQGVIEGRMEGFGYDPSSLPEEDVYGRLIDNFTCEDVAAASDEEGYYDIKGTLYSDDPDLSDDELYAIRRTREYIREQILNGSDRDPTAIDLPRG